VVNVLKAQGLSRGEVTLAQIERASRFVESPITYSILRRGDLCVVVPAADLGLTQKVYSLGVRTVVSWGVACLRKLAEQVGTDRIDFVEAVLQARPSFRWLGQSSGWFWFEHDGSRLLRSIEKALGERAPLDPEDLAEAVFQRRPVEFVPPLGVLQELCRQLPQLSLDPRGRVSLARAA
jgi:hypothetical protein